MRKSDSAGNAPATAGNEGARLDSWKEIAAYLKRDVRTVQRWESTEGLPAHRHVHQLRSSVYAFAGELDRWWSGRKQGLESSTSGGFEKGNPRLKARYAVGAASFIAATVVMAWWMIVTAHPGGESLKVRPLTAERGLEQDPVFSPDGSKIAYMWIKEGEEYFDIYVRSLSSGDSLQVTRTPDNQEYSIAWSPDGNWLAFIGVRDEKPWIVLAPALGGPERRITAMNPSEYSVPGHFLSWAPDGKTIVFPDHNPGDEFVALHAVSVASGERRRLILPPVGAVDTSPSISSDGTLLAFVRSGTAALTSRIFLAHLSSSVHVLGTPTPLAQEEKVVGDVNWVGSERRLAYLYPWYSQGTGGLWTVRVDSRDRPRLVLPLSTLGDTHARLSPDGKKLAYSPIPAGTGFARVELPNDPNREVPLRKIPSSTAQNREPSFSPNGERFAYSSVRSGHPEIWTSRTDGSQPIRITHMEGPATGAPQWSPDGARIAFDSSPDSNSDIWIVNGDGGQPVRFTTEPSAEFNPSWSGDGRWIYFASNRSGTREIWKAPSAGGPAVQVTRRGGFGGFESPDGKYFYYGTRHLGPELRRVPVAGGEEVTVVPSFHLLQDMSVGRTGVYFLSFCPPCHRRRQAWELHRYRFSDGKEEVLARFWTRMGWGLAVSPNESFVLLNVYERPGANIYIAEGLR